MTRFRMKVREGSNVTTHRFESSEGLFDAINEKAADLAQSAARKPVKSMFRDYEAIELVHGRIEVSIATGRFKHRRGGIDVRRDGSIEAFVGRTNRTVVEPTPGETIPQALRRELLKP